MNKVIVLLVVGIVGLWGCETQAPEGVGDGEALAAAGMSAAEAGSTLRAAEKQSTAVVVRRVATGEGDVSYDGRYLAYMDGETGNIAVRDLRTGEIRKLTDEGSWGGSEGYGMDPKISRDSRQVAFTWARPYRNSERYELRIVGMDGTGLRTLYRDDSVGWIHTEAWHPDGARLLAKAIRHDGPRQILDISVSDGASRILMTTGPETLGHMSFSPDGRSVVFDRFVEEGSENRDIYLMAADGSREVRIVEHPGTDLLLGWAPDGEHILFASDRQGTLGAWLLPLEDGEPSGEPVLVRPDLWRMTPVGFAEDGSYYYGVSTTKRTVYVARMDPATSDFLTNPTPVPQPAAGSDRDIYPRWSPDGRILAYTSVRRTAGVERPAMINLSVETGETREISRRGVNWVSPRLWSRDGRFILGGGRDAEDRGGFFQINVLTGEAEPFPNFWGVNIRAPLGLSPDEESLYYMVWLDDGAGIAVRGLEGGMEELLYRWKGYGTAALSPDGEWLAFGEEAAEGYELLLMPVTGGEPEVLVRFPPEDGWTGVITWTPDGEHVIYRNDRQIWSVPRLGGVPLKLDWPIDEALVGAMRHIRFSPDGRRIAFDAETGEEELWVMENFLSGH